MAQEYGAAQPIVDVFKKGYRAATKVGSYTPSSEKKSDTSWHDSMVKQANESFKRKASAPSTTPAKKTAKKQTKRVQTKQ